MNDNRDEIQRLRAMRAEAINRGDFGRADAIGADLARLESAAGGTIDPITGMPAASASAPSAPQGAPFPQRRDERPAQGRPAYEDQHGPAPRQSAPAPAPQPASPSAPQGAPAPRREARDARCMEADVRQQENTYRHEPAQESAYRPEPSRPAYAGDDRGAKTEAAAEERGGSREEKRRGRFGKAEGKKDAKPAEGHDPSTAPRRAAPKPAPAGPSKGTRALTVVAAAAIAVSVGATVFSGMRLAESSAIIAKNEANSVNVVVTNRDVAAGETITEADLETQAVPKAYCPTDAATKVSDVAGHTSLTTQTAGASISLSSLQASSSPAHITSAIEDGHVAIALSLDSSKSLSPLLRVGDRVNVMAVVSDGATSSAETVCANVKIIALDSALSGSPDAGYSLVTLDVTEDQAAAIVANPNVTLTAIPQTAEGASDAE